MRLLTQPDEEEVHPRYENLPNPCCLAIHLSPCETAALLSCHNMMQWDKLFLVLDHASQSSSLSALNLTKRFVGRKHQLLHVDVLNHCSTLMSKILLDLPECVSAAKR